MGGPFGVTFVPNGALWASKLGEIRALVSARGPGGVPEWIWEPFGSHWEQFCDFMMVFYDLSWIVEVFKEFLTFCLR